MVDKVIIPLEIQQTGRGLAQATEQATKLRDALKEAADMSAHVRVPLATSAARQGIAARAAAAQPGGGASDTNLSRGVAGQTGASGRDFAAQAQGLGGLVHVYATFAANLYAVTAAFGALSKAADTANIVMGLEQLGAASGRSLGALAKQMALASDGAISLRQAMTSTAMATAGGMSSDAILRMTEVAKKASLALGRDMTDSMDRLTKGIVKIQPELLDELGIMTRVIPAQQKYARELGKSTEALSDFEKRQAFANAVLTEGEAKFGKIEIQANAYSKLAASLSNLATEGLNAINVVLLPLAKILSESPVGLTMAVGTVAAVLLKQAIPALGQYREGIEKLQKLSLERAKEKSNVLGDMGQYDNTEAEKAKEAYKRTNLYAQKSAEDRAKIDIEAEKVYHATLERRAESAKFFASHEAANTRIVERAYTNAANANLKADVAQTQSKYGMIAAYQRLNQEINTATSGKRIVELGEGVQGVVPKMSVLEGGVRKFAGTLAIAGTAVMTLLEAFAPWLMLAGLVAAGIALIFDHMKDAGKESEKFNASLDLLNDGVKTVSTTIEAINRKPFLEQLNAESMSARANAISNVSDNLKKLVKDAGDLASKMNIWDKFSDARMWNTLKNIGNLRSLNLVDKSHLAEDTSKAISEAIIAAAIAVEGGPGEQQLKASMSAILKGSYTSIDDLKNRLSTVGDGLINNKDKITAALSETANAAQKTASAGERLKTAWDAAAKSWDSIVASLSVTDPLGKLGQQSLEVSFAMSQAFDDPLARLGELTKLTTDFQRLRMLSPETQKELIEFGFQLERSGKAVEELKKKLEEQKKVAKDAADQALIVAKAMDTSKDRSTSARGVPMPWERGVANTGGLEAAAKAKADNAAEQVKIIEKQIAAEQERMQNNALYIKAQNEVFTTGAQQIETALATGLEKSGIDLKLKMLSGNNTPAGIAQSAKLQIQAIEIQAKGIRANQELVIATNNLARITEAASINDRAKFLNSAEYTGNATDKALEMSKLEKRGDELAKLIFLSSKSNEEIMKIAKGVSLNAGKPIVGPSGQVIKGAGGKQQDFGVDPALRSPAQILTKEREPIIAGDFKIAALENEKLGITLEAGRKTIIATNDELKAQRETTTAIAQANLSIFNSAEKYAPYLGEATLKSKQNLETAVRTAQQASTIADLEAKISSEQKLQADMSANPKNFAAEDIAAQSATVLSAQVKLTEQKKQNAEQDRVAAKKALDDSIDDQIKAYAFLAALDKEANDRRINSRQTDINIGSMQLSMFNTTKGLLETTLITKQKDIDLSKEKLDYDTKISNELRDYILNIDTLNTKLKSVEGTDAYAKIELQIKSAKATHDAFLENINKENQTRKNSIIYTAAYNVALAELNKKEEEAAKLRESAASANTVNQIRLTQLTNANSLLGSEIATRQVIIDLKNQELAQEEKMAKFENEHTARLKAFETAQTAPGLSEKDKTEIVENLRKENEQYERKKKDLKAVNKATVENITTTAAYTKAIAQLTEQESLAAAKRSLRLSMVSNREALGTISAGQSATEKYSVSREQSEAQFKKDSVGLQPSIDSAKAKAKTLDNAEAIAANQADIDAWEKKLKLLTEAKDTQDNILIGEKNTAVQLAINNLELEEQARLTATASSYTENMTTAFGELGAAIGSATEALVKMANDQISFTKEQAKLKDQLAGDLNSDERVLIEKKLGDLEKKNTTNQITNIGKIAGASKKFFDQKTMGYKVMEGIEKASAMVSAGIQAKQLATDASNMLAKIGIDIPGIFTSFMAWMGPWGPPAAVAALAALGISASAPSSTGDMVDMTGKTSAERQKTQGTGGVFGDEEAKTTTIVNSLEMLAKNSIEGLNYDNELLKAMRRVADSVTGAAKSIYAAPTIRTGQGFGTSEGSKSTMGSFGSVPVLGKTLDSIFGGGTTTSTKITSAGIQLKGTFKEVMDDVSGSITQFKDVLTTSHTDGGWFGSDSDSSSLAHQVQNLGGNTSRAIADIFGQANQMFAILGNKTNVSAASINKVLETFDVSMPIDLMNKTGQELVDELNAVIGERISNAAQKIFTGFEKYREFGEDYLGTVLRVVDGNDKVNQSLLSIGHAFSIVGRFDISEDMIKIAGGLEAFQTETAFFRDNFLTAAEKLAPVQKSVNDQLTKLGINIGISRDDFKKLVISQDLSTRSGREMYQSLLELAPGFDTVSKAMDDLAIKSLDLEAKIYELIGQKSTALAIARNKELAAMDASLRPRQIYINALTDEIAIRDKLKAAYDSSNKSVNAAIVSLNNYKTALLAGAASTLTPAQKYADAAAIFKATAQAAAVKITTSSTAADIATRDEAVAKLSSVSDSFLANSKEMNAGTTQYATDLAMVTTAVTDATTAMGTQLSDAKLQLGFLDTIAAATQTTADILTEYLTAQGITNSAQTGAVASGSVAATFQIPGHADGGLAKGISMVGENGPELVDFKNPGRVYSNQASNELFSTKELVEEIKALRKEVADLRADQKEQTGHLITTTYDANNKNAEVIVTANQEALNNQNWSTRSKVKVA